MDSWGLENPSWLIATLMLAALSIILAKFDQNAISRGHFGLFLNTIIAVVSQSVQALPHLLIHRPVAMPVV